MKLKDVAEHLRTTVPLFKDTGDLVAGEDIDILRAYATCPNCDYCPTDEEILEAVGRAEQPDDWWDALCEATEAGDHDENCPAKS